MQPLPYIAVFYLKWFPFYSINVTLPGQQAFIIVDSRVFQSDHHHLTNQILYHCTLRCNLVGTTAVSRLLTLLHGPSLTCPLPSVPSLLPILTALIFHSDSLRIAMPPKRTPQPGGTSDPDDRATSPSPSGFATLSASIAALDTRFNGLDSRFNAIDARFNATDVVLNRITSRLDTMDTRLTAHELALNNVTTRLDKIEQRERTVPKASFSEKSPADEDNYEQTEQDTTPQPPPDTAVVVGKIEKISPKILVPFYPDKGATAKY